MARKRISRPVATSTKGSLKQGHQQTREQKLLTALNKTQSWLENRVAFRSEFGHSINQLNQSS